MGDIPIIHPVHDHDFARIDKTMYLWYFDMFDPSTYQPPIIHLSSTNYDMSYHSIDVREKIRDTSVCLLFNMGCTCMVST